MLWSQVGRQPHNTLPGIGVDVLAGVPARRGGVRKSLDYPETKHAEVAPGASIRCSPFDTDAPLGALPRTRRCPASPLRRQCAGSHATPVVRNGSYRRRPTKPPPSASDSDGCRVGIYPLPLVGPAEITEGMPGVVPLVQLTFIGSNRAAGLVGIYPLPRTRWNIPPP
jgi:hypothetical protein